MSNRSRTLPALVLYLSLRVFAGYGSAAEITVDLETAYHLGDSTSFDRKKFITIHSAPTENDWQGHTDKLDYLTDVLDVTFARETGSLAWALTQLPEDPANPGHVLFDAMKRDADYYRQRYQNHPELHKYAKNTDLVVAAQVHPFWADGTLITPPDGSKPWALANAEATAQYMVYWLNMFTGGNGPPRPQYLEVMNEPLYALLKPGSDVTPHEVFVYHNRVAAVIKALNQQVLIGGYTTAFPDLEKDNFAEWNETWKDFIDLTGDSIDFHSLHLYDFPGINEGVQQYRKGAQLEATLDLIDAYTRIKHGKSKPFLISEYGSQLNDWYDEPWSAYRDWLCIKAINSMMMQFMQRPDQMLKAIPFITAKAEWGFNYTQTNQPYFWRLLRHENEPAEQTGDWIWTDQIKFYQLWSGVRGERRRITSNNQNLLVDCYVDGNVGWIIVNNLVPNREELEVSGLSRENTEKLIFKHLYLNDNAPRLDYLPVSTDQNKFTIGAESTVILEFHLKEPIAPKVNLKRERHYSDKVVQPIKANETITFSFKNLPTEGLREAKLRLAVDRPHGTSLKPLIEVNGVKVSHVPSLKGPSQKERLSVTGVIEIPCDPATLSTDTDIKVTFSNEGGHVSSALLDTIRTTKASD